LQSWENKAFSQENKTPGQENKAPARENKTPGQENKAPARENKTPGQENKAPARENKTPGQENKASARENETPGQENKTPGWQNKARGRQNRPFCHPQARFPWSSLYKIWRNKRTGKKKRKSRKKGLSRRRGVTEGTEEHGNQFSTTNHTNRVPSVRPRTCCKKTIFAIIPSRIIVYLKTNSGLNSQKAFPNSPVYFFFLTSNHPMNVLRKNLTDYFLSFHNKGGLTFGVLLG